MSKYLMLLYIDIHVKLLVPYKVILHKLLRFQLIFLHYLLVDTFLNHLYIHLHHIIYYLNESLYELFQHYECLTVHLQLLINDEFLNHSQDYLKKNFSNFHFHNNLKPSYNLWYLDLELFHNIEQYHKDESEDGI